MHMYFIAYIQFNATLCSKYVRVTLKMASFLRARSMHIAFARSLALSLSLYIPLSLSVSCLNRVHLGAM